MKGVVKAMISLAREEDNEDLSSLAAGISGIDDVNEDLGENSTSSAFPSASQARSVLGYVSVSRQLGSGKFRMRHLSIFIFLSF